MKKKPVSEKQNIAFYTSEVYDAAYDINADVVIIRSDFKSAKKKISSWKKHGYSVHFAANLIWGDFSEYLDGRWDDTNHWEEVQTDRFGKYVFHGPNIPYMVPTVSFNNYILSKLMPILEYGVDAIHFEEPYFFVKSGYSGGFKKEWEMYFKTPWKPIHEDINTQYLASVLKGKLIYRSIAFLSTALKSHSKYHLGRDLKIYVQTRGYLNNIHNRTITPIKKITESKYIDGIVVDADTLVQRLTDEEGESTRLFESAFIEFNSLKECLRFDSKDIWFSFNFIDKNSISSWETNRHNYLSKLSAALFVPDVDKYAICNMPEHIYGSSARKIPEEYSMMVYNCTSVLGRKQYPREEWAGTDDNPIGIFISDSIMYQQDYPSDDTYGNINQNDISNFNNFYGLAHPFFSGGQKISMIPIEHVINDSRYLNNYSAMILSYDFMKPARPSIHYALNEWVRSGGVLLVAGTNNDSYNGLSSWWNTAPNDYKHPMQHLFELLGVDKQADDLVKKIGKTNQPGKILSDGIISVGKGYFAYFPERPARCISEPRYAKYIRELFFTAAAKKKIHFASKAHYSLKKGPYLIVTDISNGHTTYEKEGRFTDIIDPSLSLKSKISLNKDRFTLAYDEEAKPDDDFDIIAATGKILNIVRNETEISFIIRPLKGLPGYIRVYFPYPSVITVNDENYKPEKTEGSKTVLIKFEPSEKDITVKIRRKRI